MAIDHVDSNFDGLQSIGRHAWIAAMSGPDHIAARHFHGSPLNSRGKNPRCQVPGCKADLASQPKLYCLRKRICMQHMQADALRFPGNHWFRFCFQCAKAEPLACFDGRKRSCRQALHKRKTRPLYRLANNCFQDNMHWQPPHNPDLQQHLHNTEDNRPGLLAANSEDQQLAAASQTLAAAQKMAEQASRAIAALQNSAIATRCMQHSVREPAAATVQVWPSQGLLPASTAGLQTATTVTTLDKQPVQYDSDDSFGSLLNSLLLLDDDDNSCTSDNSPLAAVSLQTSNEDAPWNVTLPAHPELLEVPMLPTSTCNSSPAATCSTPEMAAFTIGSVATGQTSTGPVVGAQLHHDGALLMGSQFLGPSVDLGLPADTATVCAHVQPAQQHSGKGFPQVNCDSTVPASGISPGSSCPYGAYTQHLQVPLPGAEEQLRALGATVQQLSHAVEALRERVRMR